MLTILCYSVFTFLGSIATNVWELGIFRLLAGIGIGGEWTLGSVFIAEEWPEDRRIQGACYMHTGYYFGTLLASALNSLVGAHYGWRAMFAVGGSPALLTALIRFGVREPERWRAAGRTRRAFAQIFSRSVVSSRSAALSWPVRTCRAISSVAFTSICWAAKEMQLSRMAKTRSAKGMASTANSITVVPLRFPTKRASSDGRAGFVSGP